MGKPTGFMESNREQPDKRPPQERIRDWKEYILPMTPPALKTQASRCMDCGIPYCHTGCPLGNLIPDFNDLVFKDRWREAIERLHATNNFPEFTGKLCPAPCENSCTLGLPQYEQPVSIKQIEWAIIDHAWAEGWIAPRPPKNLTGKKVAVVGSGPAGLACAQQLRRVGHEVTLFEKADRPGGLLRYGIPEFKMEKRILDRRISQMEAEGVVFKNGMNVGVDLKAEALRRDFDAVVLCGGAEQPRDLPVPGRELKGVHFAMEFLVQSNHVQEGDRVPEQILAGGRHVVVIGGGDTGADCISTSLRQGAASVTTLELLPKPPEKRAPNNPWPEWARILRKAPAHEEGGEILYSVLTRGFTGSGGTVKTLKAVKVEWDPQPQGPPKMREVQGSEFEIKADLVLLAMGFTGPATSPLYDALGLKRDARGNVASDAERGTNVPGIFVAGDMTRGQSLIVWAIAEGRRAARSADRWLMGSTTLEAPDL